MIKKLVQKDALDILDYCTNNRDNDFYLTEKNERKFFTSEHDVKKLFRCTGALGDKDDKGDVRGIAVIWKSLGNNIPRYYLKISAQNEMVGQRLLKVLLWHFGQYELYIKLSKQNKLLSMLKVHGFKFFGDRGKEILLKKDKFLIPERSYQKDNRDDTE